MKNTVENIVASAVLEDVQDLTVNGKVYKVAPASVATVIEVSKYISQLPIINVKEDSKEKLLEVLSVAKDCAYLGDIAAIMMLGKKYLVTETVIVEKSFFGLRKKEIKVTVDNQKLLANKLLLELDSMQLSALISRLFEFGKTGFFLGTITFLNDVNLLKVTKAQKTTLSGQ